MAELLSQILRFRIRKMASLWYDSTVIAQVNAGASLLNSGSIRVYTGSQSALNGAVTGVLLVSMSFSSTAFANSVASSGVVTANANSILSGTAAATGTAGYFALIMSDGVTVILTGTVGTSGADLNFSNLSITS